MNAGTIEPIYCVSCGRCADWLKVNTVELLGGGLERTAAQVALNKGWCIRPPWGWVCPECKQEVVRGRQNNVAAARKMTRHFRSDGTEVG